MSLSGEQIVFAGMLGKLLCFASKQVIPVKICELFRSPEKQLKLYRQGRTKTLESKHIKGLAADLAIIREGKYISTSESYTPLGDYWESIGGRWGGSWHTFKDSVHFEYDSTTYFAKLKEIETVSTPVKKLEGAGPVA